MKLAAFVLALLFVLPCGVAPAQIPSLCDQQTDPPGAKAELEAVVAACAADLAAKPGDTEAVYRYALALERAGRVEDALGMYRWAADDGFGLAIEAVQRLTGTDSAPETDWNTERAELGRSMTGIAAAMRRFESELPPDPSDPLNVIAEIGTDPETITQWVATHTRLIPYSGSLRGARGVLSDRSGNSLDRALALAALLEAAGEEVRIARAPLDEAQAHALLAASLAAEVQAPGFALLSADDMLATLRASGVAEDVATEAIERTLDGRKIVDATLQRQLAVLLPVLAPASQQAVETTALDERSIEHLKDHFWVASRRGAGWVDHDPDARIVGPLRTAEDFAPEALPEALRHTATVRVIVELQAASGRREETLVEWTGYTGVGTGNTLVSLSHTNDAVDAMAQLVNGGASREAFLAAVDATSSWTPMLRVDGQVIVDKLFTSDGQVRTVDPNVLTQVGRENTEAFDQAGDLLGGDGDGIPPESGVPTAEWLEIELNGPGAAPRIERRALFDLVGPARRAEEGTVTPDADQLRDRALRLTGQSDILIVAANPSRAQFSRTTLASVAEAADNLQTLVLEPDRPDLSALPRGPQLAWPLRQFALERLADKAAPAIAAPNVFVFHQRVVWSPAATVYGLNEIDIVFNDVFAPNLVEARLRQGIVDSILEGALLKGAVSTANDTVADIAAGNDWTLLRFGQEEGLDRLNPDLRQRVESDLAAGRVVLVSLGESSRGWWRVDVSGTVLAMGANGGGAAFVEDAMLKINLVGAGMCFAAVGTALAGGDSLVMAGAICMIAGGVGGAGAAFAAASGMATGAGVFPAVAVALALDGIGGGLAIGAGAAGG